MYKILLFIRNFCNLFGKEFFILKITFSKYPQGSLQFDYNMHFTIIGGFD